MEIEIEKNIPIPEKPLRKRRGKYPFIKMEIGDSFAVKITNEWNGKNIKNSLYSSYKNFKRRFKMNWNFAIRILENEVRIWRIK